ncbi:PAS domain-containing sensor histidine kinase [Desulfobacter hydrogenophilus]|uniref:PAS domain-containing sensor histidine kinase n=1 Tax=Desulfobacter hydrogenophilus TaxID=2291 RepID=UPI001F5FC947|nr:PAS domain-containing sensor histidine kinase [Desulfobacter hydrogenophilus]
MESLFKKIKIKVLRDSAAKNQKLKSEKELYSAFNAMKSAVLIIDKDHYILKSNSAAERLFNKNDSKIIGKKCWTVVHGTAQPIKDCPVLKAGQSLQQESIELQINERWFEIVVNPILDYRRRPSKYIHIITDITDSKRLSDQLHRSQQLLANTQRLAKTGGWEWNIERQKMYWTKELYRLHGFEPSQFEPGSPDHINTSLECYSPEDQPKLLDAFHRCEKEGVAYELEFELRRSSGEKIWIKTVAEPIWKGDTVEKVLGNVIDITDRKHAEKVLRKSEQAFRNLFDNHAAVKLLIDPDTGRIIAANKAAENFYGWPCTTLAQMNINQINTKSLDEIKTLMSNAKNQKRIHFDFQHRLADGSIRDVEVFSSGVEMNGQKYLHSIVHDITEQKKTQRDMEELQIQNWHLKKQKSLSRMAGAIAHHFNNHLMAIMGNLELSLKLIERGESPLKNIMKSMQVAQTAAKVNGLMLTYLGKNVSGKIQMDMGKVCSMTIPLLRVSLSSNIVLETDFPNQGPMIYGHENQIQQLVTNLVTNAAESYQKQGTIYLSLKTVLANEIPKKHRFPVAWMPGQDDYACLEVTDSGCGIEEQNIEKIFDPFFSTKATGRGLELPVVLGIAQANNGVITVENKRGKGSTFRFFTPVKTTLNS